MAAETYCWRHKRHMKPGRSKMCCGACAARGILTFLSAGPGIAPKNAIVDVPAAVYIAPDDVELYGAAAPQIQRDRQAEDRLEYLRAELRAERISYGELSELQALIPFIAAGDTELREAAGVPEEAEPPTRVIFRTYRTKPYEVVAIFPDMAGSPECDASVYQHVGQHGSADYHAMIKITRPAVPADYASLKRELESIGYTLRIVTRKGSK